MNEVELSLLIKLLEIAIKNGFYSDYFKIVTPRQFLTPYYQDAVNRGARNWYYSIIFDHAFAIAFWGTKRVFCGRDYLLHAWEFHLQEMVVEEEPLKYMEKFA